MKNSAIIPMTHSGSNNKTYAVMKIYNNLLAEFKREQTGYASIAIIPQSCIGSVAAMMILMSDLPKIPLLVLLFLVTILCMAYNGAVLAQLKSKTIFNLLIISVVFSGSVIIANLF